MAPKVGVLNDLIAPVVNALGYEFVGCMHIPQGRHSLLRIYIDSEKGITLDDCEKVSRQVSAVFDVEDPITTHYTLEVSSPGLDRPLFTLTQFERFVGQAMKIRLHAPVNGRRNFTGVLTRIVDEQLIMTVDDTDFTLPFASIDKANLAPEFPRK